MAIARVTSAAFASGLNPTTPFDNSFNCSGGDYLFVAVELAVGNFTLSDLRYAGVGFDWSDTRSSTNGNHSRIYIAGLAGPASGSNTLRAAFAGQSPLVVIVNAVSYSGVKQTGQPDAGPNQNDVTATSITMSATIVAANSWLVEGVVADAAATSAGTGAHLVVQDSTYNALTIYDSNGALSAGSHSMTVNATGTDTLNAIIASLAPAVVAVTKPPFLTLLGAGN